MTMNSTSNSSKKVLFDRLPETREEKLLVLELLKRQERESGSIWQSRFLSLDADTAWDFALRCKTWNEAAGEVQYLPEKEYLREITVAWVNALQTGEPLVIEKCRRMVVSWLLRILEMWRMGVSRFDHVLCGIDYEAAASHCWRYSQVYGELKRENPFWKLPEPKIIRAKGDKFLDSFGFPNGSLTVTHNQEGGGLQGEGKGAITFEELSRYRYPASIWAQGKILTSGAAGGKRGALIAVTNAGMNDEWQAIKKWQ